MTRVVSSGFYAMGSVGFRHRLGQMTHRLPFLMPSIRACSTQEQPLVFRANLGPLGKEGALGAFLLATLTPTGLYFHQLPSLQKSNSWKRITELGETALTHEKNQKIRFSIHEQLVSSYFKLGFFADAKRHALKLMDLSKAMDDHEKVVEALYKCSASFRGLAHFALTAEDRKKNFGLAKSFADQALTLVETHCSNPTLRAKALFNASACECDNPQGNFAQGLAHIEKAFTLFILSPEGDYVDRSFLRLGRAYLLNGRIEESRLVVDQLKPVFSSRQVDERTKMHLHFLEAQVLNAEKKFTEALGVINEGRKLAILLNAEADIHRFDLLWAEVSHK